MADVEEKCSLAWLLILPLLRNVVCANLFQAFHGMLVKSTVQAAARLYATRAKFLSRAALLEIAPTGL